MSVCTTWSRSAAAQVRLELDSLLSADDSVDAIMRESHTRALAEAELAPFMDPLIAQLLALQAGAGNKSPKT